MMLKVEIGTEITLNDDPARDVTVCGYTMYEDILYYVCLYEDGSQGDRHFSTVEGAHVRNRNAG